MDVERIERALGEGPPDEPTYVPGSFRRGSLPAWRLAAAGLAVGAALISGIAIGTGLGLLRDDVGNAPAPRVLAAADLQGVWEAEPIAIDAWTEALLARGFGQTDVDAFLEHDSFEDQVRYQLRFVDDRFIVQAAYDDQPVLTLGGGTFTLDENGLVDLVEIVDGAEVGCEFTVTAVIYGSQLLMDVLEFRGCEADEQMANTLFFDVAVYDRAEG